MFKMLRFFIRRDRVWLSVWLAGIVALNVMFAPMLTKIVPTQQDLMSYALTLKNPAMIAMCGPAYGTEYTYGIMYVQMIVIWCAMLIAVMNILFVSRHTRNDEDDGLTEIIRSLPVSRSAGLSGAAVLAVIANAIQGMLSGILIAAFGVADMPPAGCLLIGGIYAVIGIFFAAVAMLFAQLAQTARGLVGYSFVVLGILYVMRAAGDVKENALSWISPMGQIYKSQPFVKDSIWPIALVLMESVAIAAVAFVLNMRRDFGSGFIPVRRGRAHAGRLLSGESGLAWRLIRLPAIAWVVAMFLLGISYGSIFGDFETFMSENEMIRKLVETDSGGSMMDSFLGYIMVVMSLVACIPLISSVMKIRSEEKKGRLEPVYACAVSKTRNIISYALLTISLSFALQLALGVGLWAAAYQSMDSPLPFGEVVLSAVVSLPAMWVLAAVTVLLIGIAPKRAGLAWAYYGIAFGLMYFGRILDIPEWTAKLSPFGYLSDYPSENIAAVPLVILTVIAVVFAAFGVAAYGRRETYSV